MPRLPLRDVLVIDQSVLARNMYQLLFSAQRSFRVRFSEEYQTLFKRSLRLRPDLMIINSNALKDYESLQFPCPTILVISKNRFDLKEGALGLDKVVLIEKPFYPYDLLAMAHRFVQVPPKKRRARRRKKK